MRLYFKVFFIFLHSHDLDSCINLQFLGSLPAIFIMESLMEQVAKSIDKDATDIRLMNMYTQGQVKKNSRTLIA